MIIVQPLSIRSNNSTPFLRPASCSTVYTVHGVNINNSWNVAPNLPATLVEIQSFNFDSTAPTRKGEEFKTTYPSSDLCLLSRVTPFGCISSLPFRALVRSPKFWKQVFLIQGFLILICIYTTFLLVILGARLVFQGSLPPWNYIFYIYGCQLY